MRRWLATLVAVGACSGAAPEAGPRVIVTTDPQGQLDLAALTTEPPAPHRVLLAPNRVELTLPPGTADVEVRHPEGCTTRLALDAKAAETPAQATMAALIVVPDDQPQLGFDAPFEVRVAPGCDEAKTRGRIEWKRVGPTDVPFTTDEGGWVVRGKTPTLAAAHPAPLPQAGIVAFSPATRGELLLELTFTHGVDGRTIKRRVSVAATPRATGVPTVGLGHEVFLTGTGWTIRQPALGGRAVPIVKGELTSFVPDAQGHWIFSKDGKEMTLQSGRGDEMPLDCARGDCHANVGVELTGNKMATVFTRGLEGALGDDYDPRCAIACHTAGEPGLADGGFTHVRKDEALTIPTALGKDAWGRLPRALRRVANVGCVACHGPAAIPAPAARWSILRADVCAICHDAPPRYGHVAAWRSSRMARSDADPRTREGACAGCHTTHGYLAARGIRPIKDESIPPPEVGPVGVSCTACHANHGAHQDTALLRKLDPPASLGAVPAEVAGGISQVCLHCHAPTAANGAPEAAAAALWLGKGGVEVATGKALDGPAQHAAIPGGCVGCHRESKDAVVAERGRHHGFQPDAKACVACHKDGPAEKVDGGAKTIAERAQGLLAKLRARGIVRGDGPPHAGAGVVPKDGPLANAARNVLLVAEDPAAAAHNAAYARRLLDEAATVLK